MFTPAYTRQFESDLKRLRRGGHDLAELKAMMVRIMAGERLAPQFKDHKLSGAWQGRRECHLRPDWLLIYKIDPQQTSSSLSAPEVIPTFSVNANGGMRCAFPPYGSYE